MNCPVHNEPMTEREGKFGKFWSHKTQDENYPSGWCNGKEPKKDPSELINEKLDKLLGDIYKLNVRFDELAKYLNKQFTTTRKNINEENPF